MQFQRVQRKTVTVPIVSLIDILTILLIFFIVTTTFKEPEPVIDVQLPLVSQDSSLQTEIVTPPVTLSVSEKGQIFLNDLEVLPGDLGTHLELFESVYGDRKLALKVDEGCPLGTMVKVWEALTEAGFDLKDTPMRIDVPES